MRRTEVHGTPEGVGEAAQDLAEDDPAVALSPHQRPKLAALRLRAAQINGELENGRLAKEDHWERVKAGALVGQRQDRTVIRAGAPGRRALSTGPTGREE